MLYTIEQQKEIDEIKQENEELKGLKTIISNLKREVNYLKNVNKN